MPRGIFSVVCTVANFGAPPIRVTPPPSARQYSASISAKCCATMNWMPKFELPSSPDFGQEDDVAIERHVLPLQQQHRHQRRR